uniref:Ion_trans_N domain-containing protein n=1 Tax=Globodera pallida TaxID=36090 RepID=A0A183C003_GLOPA
MTSGRVIRNDQRNARKSMFGWSAMFSPMTDVQNQKFEMDRPKQIGANANSLTKMASNGVEEEEEEPLVFSSYNRDCFFTPVNCFVGRAGQQASKIIGTAYNSKRQILFIRRMPKMMN